MAHLEPVWKLTGEQQKDSFTTDKHGFKMIKTDRICVSSGFIRAYLWQIFSCFIGF